MGIAMWAICALFFTSSFLLGQVCPHPLKAGLPPINWDNIKAKYPTVTPWSPGAKFPSGLLSPETLGPPTPVSHPGYKKGTKSMAGQCGVPAVQGGSRIVGGYEAVPHSFPWMAALFVDEQWFCGGTLISDEWVLTAAHCANGASSMRIMLGAHNVREDTEEGRIEVVTTDFFTHPGWSQFNLHNDLALVHLPYALNFTSMCFIQYKSLTIPQRTSGQSASPVTQKQAQLGMERRLSPA